MEATISTTEEVKDSVSYPGLPARYQMHHLQALVAGLPEEDFSTEDVQKSRGKDAVLAREEKN